MTRHRTRPSDRQAYNDPHLTSPGLFVTGEGPDKEPERACKPGSVPLRVVIIPLGRTIARRLQRPYPRNSERAALPPIWSCSRWGLACARDHSRAGGLLPHHFTLTLSGGLFSVPLSADRSAPSLAATLPCGARTFLFP